MIAMPAEFEVALVEPAVEEKDFP